MDKLLTTLYNYKGLYMNPKEEYIILLGEKVAIADLSETQAKSFLRLILKKQRESKEKWEREIEQHCRQRH